MDEYEVLGEKMKIRTKLSAVVFLLFTTFSSFASEYSRYGDGWEIFASTEEGREGNIMTFSVNNDHTDPSVRGRRLFRDAFEYLDELRPIDGIRGIWGSGDNIIGFIRALASSIFNHVSLQGLGASIEGDMIHACPERIRAEIARRGLDESLLLRQAAMQTWTGRQATARGYTDVRIVQFRSNFGALSVQVLFLRPASE